MKIILIALAVVLLAFGCTKVNDFLGMENNWIGEELVESVIEGQLGLPSGTIDLTPETPE